MSSGPSGRDWSVGGDNDPGGVEIDWGAQLSSEYKVPSGVEKVQSIGIVGYDEAIEQDGECLLRFNNNTNDIGYYLDRMIETTRGKFLVAPCGVGKTKFAPGRLAAAYKASTVYMLTERILSTISAYEWYLTHPLDGVRKITMRAGGKDRTHTFASGNVEMIMMTTGAFVAKKPDIHASTLVILDEAHNPTSETLWINRNVPGQRLVQTTASPLLDKVPADFSTPFAREVQFKTSVDYYDFLDAMKERSCSGLLIVPTVRMVDEISVKLACLGYRVIFATSEQKGCLVVKANDVQRMIMSFAEIERYVAQSKTYVVATDVLQESVTLRVSLVVDIGKRVRPRRFLAQDYNDLQHFDVESILRYMRASPVVPAHRFEILQSAGRVGRMQLPDKQLAIIGELNGIRLGTYGVFSYNHRVAVGGKLDTRLARANYRKVQQLAREKRSARLLSELADHLKLECADRAYTREDFERVVAESLPQLKPDYVPTVAKLVPDSLVSLAALALGSDDSDSESIIIITQTPDATIEPRVEEVEEPHTRPEVEIEPETKKSANPHVATDEPVKRTRGNRAGGKKKHLRPGYCAMKMYSGKQRRELPFHKNMTLEELMDFPAPAYANEKRLLFKRTLRCHVAKATDQVSFVQQLSWIRAEHFPRVIIGCDEEILDISPEEFEIFLDATTPPAEKPEPRQVMVGGAGTCWMAFGPLVADLRCSKAAKVKRLNPKAKIKRMEVSPSAPIVSPSGEQTGLFAPQYEKAIRVSQLELARTLKRNSDDATRRSLRVVWTWASDGDMHIEYVGDRKYRNSVCLGTFIKDLLEAPWRLPMPVGRKPEPRDDAGALDAGINSVSVGLAKEAVESRVGNVALDEFDRTRAYCPWHVDKDLRRFMKMAGLPFTETSPTEHTHAVHASIRRTKYKDIYPKHIDQDVTIYQIKQAHADMIDVDYQKHVKNAIIDANDMGRWNTESVSEFVFKHEQPSTSLVIFDEWGHYCTPASVVDFMANNDNVTTLIVSHETPLLALYAAKSPVPELWQHKRVGDTLVVQIEKEGRPYHQPFDFTLLLSRKIVCPERALVLHCAVVWQCHNTYVQTITKYNVQVPQHISVETYGFMPLPIMFRDQLEADMVPVRLWNEVLQYARAMPSVTVRDLHAKLRQSIDPRYEQLDHNTACVMVSCIKAIVSIDVYGDAETKFYDTIAGKLYYNIPGRLKKWWKSKTTKAWHRRWIGMTAAEHPLMTIDLAVVHVRGIPKNAIGSIYKKSNPKLKIKDMNLDGNDDVFGTFWEVDPETQPELTDVLMRWHRRLFYGKKDAHAILQSIISQKAGLFFSEEHFPTTYGRTQPRDILARQAYRWRKERGRLAEVQDSDSWTELGRDPPEHVPGVADEDSTIIGSGFSRGYHRDRQHLHPLLRDLSVAEASVATAEHVDGFEGGLTDHSGPLSTDILGEEPRVLPVVDGEGRRALSSSRVGGSIIHLLSPAAQREAFVWEREAGDVEAEMIREQEESDYRAAAAAFDEDEVEPKDAVSVEKGVREEHASIQEKSSEDDRASETEAKAYIAGIRQQWASSPAEEQLFSVQDTRVRFEVPDGESQKSKGKRRQEVKETPGAGPSRIPESSSLLEVPVLNVPDQENDQKTKKISKLYDEVPEVPQVLRPEIPVLDKIHDALLHPVDLIPREETPSVKSATSSVQQNRSQFDSVLETGKVSFKRVGRGLTHRMWWDDQFPATIGRRHSSVPYWPVHPGTYPYPQNDCMLEVVQNLLAGLRKQKVSKVVIWGVACSIMPANEVDSYDTKMTAHFLDGLCVYYQLNVRVTSTINRPYSLGVVVGQRLDVTVDGGHWLAERVHRPIVVREKFTRGGYHEPTIKQLIQHLTNLQQIQWVPYVPDVARAEAYIREAIAGNIGTTKAEIMNVTKLKALELQIVNRGKNPKPVYLAVVRGDPGCGKSKPLLDILKNKRYHKYDAFQWIVPNSNLKKDAGEKLGVRASKPNERGTPRQYCCTFEVAQWETTGGSVVFGDEGKFAPGYWDFMLLNKPHISNLVLLFDEHQGSWHQTTPQTILTTMTTNNEWFTPYSRQFIIGTARFGPEIGNVLCTPVCRSFKHGGIYFSQHALTQWSELRIFWPDATDEELKGYWTDSVTLEATNAAVLGAEIMNETDNITMSGSQGLTKALVRLNVSKTALSRVDAAVLWNAMSRSPRLIINFDYTRDNAAMHHERLSPIWREITWYREHTRPWGKLEFDPDHTIDFRRIQNKMPSDTKLYLAFPPEKCLNWREVKHSFPRLDGFLDPFGKPTDAGGRLFFRQLDPNDEGHALDPQIGAFRSGLQVENRTEPQVVEPELPASKVRTATPPEVLKDHIEAFVSAQTSRFSRELFNSRHGYSAQFPDEPIYVLNKDAVIKREAARRLGSTDKKALAATTRLLKEMHHSDSPLYIDPYVLNRANRQTSKDAASFSAGISQRVRKGTVRDNFVELAKGEAYAVELFRRWKDFMQLRGDVRWDPIAWEKAGAKFEERRQDRSTALKKASSNRSEPDFHMITAKTQIKLKSREPNKDAKPLQIIEVFNNKYVYKWGPVGVYLLEKIQAACPPGVFLLAGKTFEDLREQNARYETGENWMSDLVAQEKDMRGWYFSFFSKIMKMFGFSDELCADFIDEHARLPIGNATILFQTLSGMIFTWLLNTTGNMARIATHYDVRPGEPSEWTGDDAKFHRVLKTRPDSKKWLLVETAEEKIITGDTGEFAMYLNRRGLTFKDPIILLDKLLVKLARGEGQNVIHGYFYEWLTIYQLGDLIHDVMTQEEMESAKILTRVMMNLRREFGISSSLNWQHVPPWDPLNHLHAGVVVTKTADLEFELETKQMRQEQEEVQEEQ